MNKYFLCSILITLTATACTLDDRKICPRENCECFIDNDNSQVLTNCSQYIPEHSHATGCDYEQKCTFDCDEGYTKSEFANEVICILEDGGCNSKLEQSRTCRNNNLSKCDKNTNTWQTVYTCTEGCDKDHCKNTCDKNDADKHRCQDENKYQICQSNDYELVWKDTNECRYGCNPETNECSRTGCKAGLASNGEDCLPWLESSDESIEIDTTLNKTITLYYFGKDGTQEIGKTLKLDVTTEKCIELSRDTLTSGNNGTELTLQAGDTLCQTELIIKAEDVQTSLSVPVTVREPKDDNHNNMYDVFEVASKQNDPCRTDEDCKGDIPGFCDSFIGSRCSTPCKSDSDCISDQFYCRKDNRCSAKAFETIWEIPQNDRTLTLPTKYATGYDINIDWGDDSELEHYANAEQPAPDDEPSESLTHTYAKPGQYHVKITGTYKNWAFADSYSSSTNRACDKFKGVVSFGPVGLAGKYTFTNCKNNDYAERPLDIPDPDMLTNMAYMFADNNVFNQDISKWDTSNVTDMSHLFENASSFNQDLDSWDTSNVTSMQSTFKSASSFNGNITHWNTQNVKSMSYMFHGAEAFNQPLKWNVEKVNSMSFMFANAKSFNQELDFTFNTPCAFNNMFDGAEMFNHASINNWDVSQGNNFIQMFHNAKSFNQPLDKWRPDATSMYSMFNGAESFNQNISVWDPSTVTNISNLFYNAKSYNQPLEWDINSIKSNKDVNNLFKDTSLSKENFCKTIAYSTKMAQYATSFGVTYTKADCSN